MKDKTKKLFDGITLISDEKIEEAVFPAKPKTKAWIKWTAAAASVCIAVSGALIAYFSVNRYNDLEAPAAGYTGHEEGSVFMSYAGPVLPLTALNASDSVAVGRELTFDFEPLREREITETYPDPQTGETVEYTYTTYDNASLVTDSYVLYNSSESDVTLELLYPYCTSFSDLYKYRPNISADGKVISSKLVSGGYAGNFTGVWGNGEVDNSSMNLDQPNEFGDYRSLLTSDDYLLSALEDITLQNIPVTVYEVVNYSADREDESSPNPSIGLTYVPSDSYTPISYGFHGYHSENGRHTQVFSVPREGMKNDGMRKCLMFIGGKPAQVEIGFYKTLDSSQSNRSDAAYGELISYESTLYDMLMAFTHEFYEFEIYENAGSEQCVVPRDMYLNEVIRALTEYGILSDSPKDRYSSGWLMELFYEVNIYQRVLYEYFSVTVPAGGSVQVDVSMLKEASFDFDCAGTDNAGISGFDAASTLGSSLSLASFSANIEDRDIVNIARQNFGFNLEKGVKHVNLDPSVEKYYLEVIRKVQ